MAIFEIKDKDRSGVIDALPAYRLRYSTFVLTASLNRTPVGSVGHFVEELPESTARRLTAVPHFIGGSGLAAGSYADLAGTGPARPDLSL